jgi:hypothetical protein
VWDSSEKGALDPGNSYFRAVHLRNYGGKLIITLTNLDDLLKIRGIQKQKEKRLTCSLP